VSADPDGECPERTRYLAFCEMEGRKVSNSIANPADEYHNWELSWPRLRKSRQREIPD
jgi:hypothetical protein